MRISSTGRHPSHAWENILPEVLAVFILLLGISQGLFTLMSVPKSVLLLSCLRVFFPLDFMDAVCSNPKLILKFNYKSFGFDCICTFVAKAGVTIVRK